MTVTYPALADERMVSAKSGAGGAVRTVRSGR